MTVADNGQLIIQNKEGKLIQQRYLFGVESILRHLTYILTHNPMLVQSLLKHKDGKTFNFIIRNIYYLTTLTITANTDTSMLVDRETKSFKVWFDGLKQDEAKSEVIVEFFRKVMLENPHLTLPEKKIKQEARTLFIKEVLKNLCDG